MSTVEVEGLLKPFYLSLSSDARRVRFGCALSNDSLARYCDRFRASRALGFGYLSRTELLALIELHPFGDKGELAFASAAHSDGTTIWRRLLPPLAIDAAQRLACRSLIVAPDMMEPYATELLREVGEIKRQPATGLLELFGFARGEIRSEASEASHA
jgi:hypothetical protein